MRFSPSRWNNRSTAIVTDDYLHEHTVGELKPRTEPIQVVDYDPEWPARFALEAHKIGTALGDHALNIEHVGSTSVPHLAAKPIIDIVVLVASSANESDYVPALERAGYQLRIREPEWHQHRMLKSLHADVNLHVFSVGCAEIERMVSFRDWLRADPGDRDLYATAKRSLAQQDWKYTQNYADAKTPIIEEILGRMRQARNSAT